MSLLFGITTSLWNIEIGKLCFKEKALRYLITMRLKQQSGLDPLRLCSYY